MTKQVFLITVCLYISSFLNAQSFTITGRVKNFPDSTRVYLNDIDAGQRIDSALIIKGMFKFKGQVAEIPGNYFLIVKLNNKNYLRGLLIENENVTITGDALTEIEYWTFTGKHEAIKNKLLLKTKELDVERNTKLGYAQMMPLLNDTSQMAKQELMKIGKRQREIDSIVKIHTLQFIKENINSYPAVSLLLGFRKYYDKNEISNYLGMLKSPYKESRFAIKLQNYLAVGDELQVGSKFVDFEAQDTSGKTHKISSFLGKYILLEFGEYFCPPCVAAIPEIREVVEKYKEQLQVINFDVDANKQQWLAAVRRDNPNWLSLWDGKGTTGNVPLKYGAYSFPTFILINPEGKIIHKSSGYAFGKIKEIVSVIK
jgi:thiol-disulfide isomerase/thioredoxin